jgi:hypothetical protein
MGGFRTAIAAMEALWDSIAKPGFKWADGPQWVWVYTFELCEGPG